MTYVVTITYPATVVSCTFSHIADALGFVMDRSSDRALPIRVITDVVQLGEWLDCFHGVWFRVVRGPLH